MLTTDNGSRCNDCHTKTAPWLLSAQCVSFQLKIAYTSNRDMIRRGNTHFRSLLHAFCFLDVTLAAHDQRPSLWRQCPCPSCARSFRYVATASPDSTCQLPILFSAALPILFSVTSHSPATCPVSPSCAPVCSSAIPPLSLSAHCSATGRQIYEPGFISLQQRDS